MNYRYIIDGLSMIYRWFVKCIFDELSMTCRGARCVHSGCRGICDRCGGVFYFFGDTVDSLAQMHILHVGLRRCRLVYAICIVILVVIFCNFVNFAEFMLLLVHRCFLLVFVSII